MQTRERKGKFKLYIFEKIFIFFKKKKIIKIKYNEIKFLIHINLLYFKIKLVK